MSRPVREVFLEAHARQGAARSVYLDQACGRDCDLRRAVERLLQAAEGAGDYFEDLASRLSREPDRAAEAEDMPKRVGAYRPLRLIGRGGMGAVYLAERIDEHFEKRVAIKILSGAISNPAAEQFANERQILAGLVHPNIARLLDGGLTAAGRPYFVMDYVDGLRIDAYCDRHRLSIERRLRLFLQVCQAVRHAHSRLVLHRDLKPGNILVKPDGLVQLLDFGVGELLESGPSDNTRNRIALTPSHASPEILRGETAGTAADVYSLGIVLYRLLTGEHPLRIDGLALPELVAAMLESSPVAASERVTRLERDRLDTVAAQRRTTGYRLARRLRSDLDAVLLKTLAADPGDRYPSVGDLASDVEAFLESRPVSVIPPTARYRLRRFVDRYRLPVSLSVLSVLLILALALTATRFAFQARSQAAIAASQRDRAEAVSEFMMGLFAYANPRRSDKGAATSAEDLIDYALKRIQRLDDQPAIQARLLELAANAYSHMDQLGLARDLLRQVVAVPAGLRDRTPAQRADTLIRLARVEADLSNWGVAERHALDAAALVRDRPNATTRLPRIWLLLGSVRLIQGDYAAAEKHLMDALRLAREVRGLARKALMARVLSHLGQLRLEQGQATAARDYFAEALELRTGSAADRTIDQADSLLRLGQAALVLGDLRAARDFVRRADAINRRLLGADSNANATTARVWGELSHAAGDDRAADEKLSEAIGIWRRMGTSDHPELAHALASLGLVRMERGAISEALPLLQESVAISDRIQPDHPYAGDRREALKRCLTALNGARR